MAGWQQADIVVLETLDLVISRMHYNPPTEITKAIDAHGHSEAKFADLQFLEKEGRLILRMRPFSSDASQELIYVGNYTVYSNSLSSCQ